MNLAEPGGDDDAASRAAGALERRWQELLVRAAQYRSPDGNAAAAG